jgi:hypothetical protein
MADKWLLDISAAGIDRLIICTLRSAAEQTVLWNQGRNTPGRIVTNAMAGQSAHQYGLALDFVIIANGKADWSGDSPAWDKAILLAEGGGMQSLRPMESAHLQHPDWKQLAGRTEV